MKQAQTPEDIRDMADEVARLMADRFGGVRRGEYPRLTMMLRRRGAALPVRLRKKAATLARLDELTAAPRIARQLDHAPASQAHHALTKHLRPLGKTGRWGNYALNFAASVALGLLVLAAVVIWIMARRGYL